MFVVMGATGHVGGAVARELAARGEPVLALGHDAAKLAALDQQGMTSAAVDINDVAALRAALRRGKRAFLLNPPGDVGGDPEANELATGRAIAAAVDGAGLEKVVVASTYGAQPSENLGDLSTLCAFEQAIQAIGVATAINRGAYYYTNFAPLLESARSGTLPSMFPKDLAIPMVAPADLGRAAAARLLSATSDTGVRYVEGPAPYSYADAARFFAAALGRAVTVVEVPRAGWEKTYREQGFSPAAAHSYARMTAVSADGGVARPADPTRGEVPLEAFIEDLIAG